MRVFVCLVALLMILSQALGQDYRPQGGETDLKLEIEGRGNIYIKLYTKLAPKTTSHIIKLANQGFYNGQRFHRVERRPKPYLVWFGDPLTKTLDLDDPQIGSGGSGTRIPFEDTNLSHEEGAVGLARALSDRDSGDSQFYLVLEPAKFLDGNYTVFGKVVSGLDIMHRLEKGDLVVSVTVVKG